MEIDKRLIKNYPLTLHDIDNLTITEIIVYLDAIKEEPEKEPVFDNEQTRAYGKLTTQQRIDLAFLMGRM